ncbi:ATP-grasp domain-containing protein [Streptomyces sp. NPDC054847]
MSRDTVLVLTGFDLHALPVVRWLADRFRVVLIASRNATNQKHYKAFVESAALAEEWIWVDDLFGDWTTVRQAEQWHARYGVRHVVCLDERGLIVAARLRGLLGVTSGQDLRSAEAFRLKHRMYELLQGAVDVPSFTVAADGFEVREAARSLGTPVVVKPVDGAGSKDTVVLRDDTALDSWLDTHPVTLGAPVLVQEFAAGDMYHVDGLTIGNEAYGITVSRYGGSTLGYQEARPLTSAMVPLSAPSHALLTEAVRTVLATLPDTGGSPFHAEFFLEESGRVRFCEIAARGGGAGVGPCWKLAYGADMFRAHALMQCGLADEVLPELPAQPAGRYGWYLESSPEGRLLGLPDRCDLPGVLEYNVTGRMGQPHGGATSSIDAIQQFVVGFQGDEDERKTFDELSRWCAQHRLLVPVTAA